MADIARGVRAFTVGTAISRVTGLGREMVFAYLYGASTSTDAFQAAFRILDLFRDLLAESALSAAAVPILTDERARGKTEQNRLASNLFNTIIVAVGIIVLLGVVTAPWMARVMAYGFTQTPGKLALTAQLAAIMFPFLLFVALAAWAMSYLYSEGEFFYPSLAPALFNLFSILIPLLLFRRLVNVGVDPILGMALGVVAGGIVQFLVQIPRLGTRGFRYRFVIDLHDRALRRTARLFVPVVVGLAGSRINIAVSVFLMSLLAERSMTWLHYAFRVYHLPLGLFGIAVGTVALPALSDLARNNQRTEIQRSLTDSLKLVLLLTVTSSALIAALALPITRLLYERGMFTAVDTRPTAYALMLYMIGVPFAGALRNVASAFYAYKDARSPMYASLIAVAFMIAANIVGMRWLGFLAFPIATSLGSIVNIAILCAWLPRWVGAFPVGGLMVYAGSLLLAAAPGAAVAWVANHWLSERLGTSALAQLGAVAVALVAGTLVCYFVTQILGMKDVRDHVRRLFRR